MNELTETPGRPGPSLVQVAAMVVAWVAVAILAGRVAEDGWLSVTRYRTPFRFIDGDATQGPSITHRVVLVLIDGLRLDRSRGLRHLDELRKRGADFDCLAGIPSYSRAARASLVTGAWPEVHGVTTNRHQGRLDLDNLFRAARRVSKSCAVAGSAIWPSLFGADLEGAPTLESPVKEKRGGFAEDEPRLTAFEREAVRRVLSSEATFSVVDLVVPDYAAHEYGVLSPQYARACFEADRILGSLAASLNLWTATVIVTADHGHRAGGGHGGAEDEVLHVPLVMAGRGIRVGFFGKIRQIDVAPTVAALLGLPIPGASQGRPLVEAFETGEERIQQVLRRAWEQKRAFARQYLLSLGPPADASGLPSEPPSSSARLRDGLESIDDALEAARVARAADERRSRMLPVAGVLVAVSIACAWIHRRSPAVALIVLIATGAAYATIHRLLLGWQEVVVSLSVIQRDEDVAPYFLRLFAIASLSLVAALMLTISALRVLRPRLAWTEAALLGLAGVAGAALAAALPVLASYLAQGLRMVWRIGDVEQGFAALAGLAQLRALGLTAVAAPLLAWLAARRRVAGDA
jgi:hypothetical protein